MKQGIIIVCIGIAFMAMCILDNINQEIEIRKKWEAARIERQLLQEAYHPAMDWSRGGPYRIK